MKRLGFVIKTECPEADEFFSQILPRINDRYDVVVDPYSAKRLNLTKLAVPITEMKVDMLLTLGGDGTLLFALNQIPKPDTPVLGINFGERGFLTEIEPEKFDNEWKKIEAGKYSIQSVPRISAKINSNQTAEAINEQYLYSSTPSKMLDLSISINQNTIFSGKMDGVIIASTIGSTGHAMSAGGPLIHPSLDCIEIIPIFPLKFSFRPLLVHADVTIEIELLRPHREGIIVTDGLQTTTVPPQGKIIFSRSKSAVNLVRVKDQYFDRIRKKIFQRG
ncbi:MAG: NAD(+)/NADH kinase [Candidatus Ranarchaeia archaeon]|jgi:NAD+ kinase